MRFKDFDTTEVHDSMLDAKERKKEMAQAIFTLLLSFEEHGRFKFIPFL